MKLDIKNRSSLLLYLFLATDLIFIIVHIIYKSNQVPSLAYAYYSIEEDKGYAELFQYIKEYWIALLLSFLAVQKRSFVYLGWSLLFFYVLLDDSVQIHEKLGITISSQLTFVDKFHLRAVDLGEILVSVCVGLFFLIFLTIAYRFSDSISRKSSKYLTMMLFALALFGIIADMAHMIFVSSLFEPLLAVVEDGGEMLVMSVIAWFVFLLSEHSYRTANQLEYQSNSGRLAVTSRENV